MKTSIKTLIIFFVNVILCAVVSFVQYKALYLTFLFALEAFVLITLMLKETSKRYRAIFTSILAVALSITAGIISSLVVKMDTDSFVTGLVFWVATMPLLAAAVVFARKQHISLKAGIVFTVAVVIWDLAALKPGFFENVGIYLLNPWLLPFALMYM